MRRRLDLALFVAFWLCSAGFAGAQLALTGATSGEGTQGVTAYTGPGDITTFTDWWGWRAYDAAVALAGTAAIATVKRASDSVVCNILVAGNGGVGLTSSCTGGSPPNGVTLATFCNGTTCGGFLNDQVGSLGTLESSASNTTNLTQSGLGSSPIFDTNGQIFITSNYTGFSTTGSMMLVGQRVANGSNGFAGSCGSSTCNQPHLFGDGTANQMQACNSGCGASNEFTISDGVYHSVVFNGAGNQINVDGTLTSVTASSLSSQTVAFQVGGLISQQSRAKFAEAGIANAQWSTTVMTNLCKNAQAYYGAANFGASC